MSKYFPDKWCILKVSTPSHSHHRVFATWYGSYTGGESWKLNSGIVSVTHNDHEYSFVGASGSVYVCHEDSYGMSGYSRGVLQSLINDSKVNGVTIDVIDDANHDFILRIGQ